jgi:protein-S-isoprenylcysteine O-methyltransferase Ste14
VPGSVTVLLPRLPLSPLVDFRLGAFRLGGILFLVPGAPALLGCGWEFVTTGLGIPAPINPPRALVAKGLYQFVRNPMDIAILLILAVASMMPSIGWLGSTGILQSCACQFGTSGGAR